MTGPPKRPPLGPVGRELWDELIAAYVFSPGEVPILREVCRVADVIDVLHATWLDQDGVTVGGSRGQPKPSPILAMVTEQRRLFASLIDS